MKMTPLYPMILLAPDPIEEKTESGLVLPDWSKKPKNTGTVKYLPIEAQEETGLEVGDRVLWIENPETAIEVDEELLLDVHELLCKL